MQNRSGQIERSLSLLAVFFFAVLIAVLAVFGYTPTNDGVGYLEYAEKCLAERQPYPIVALFKEPFVWNIGIINLTELSLWLSGSIMPLLVVLCMMKSLTALFTALIANKLFSPHAAFAAMLLFMLYPNNWGQSTMLSSEIPSTCIATAVVCLIIYKPTAKAAFFGGLLLALANWFRPTAAIFMVAIAAYWLFFHRKRFIRQTMSLLAGFFLFITIVGTSTYLRTGHFIYQARSYWFSMVDECYDGAPVAPHWDQPLWPEGLPRYIEGHEQMDCFQFEAIWKQRSLDWLKSHKLDYTKKIPGRLYYMYQSDYDAMPAFLPDKSKPENNYIIIPYRHLFSEALSLNAAQWLSLLCMVCYFCLLLMATVGTVRQLRLNSLLKVFLPVFIVVVGSMALVVVMHGETRFKDPLMPYLFILASSLWGFHIKKRYR